MKLTSLCVTFATLGSFAAVVACETDSSPNQNPPSGSTGFDAGGGIDSGLGGGDAGEVISQCEPPTGTPIQHDKTIEADETWAAGVHEVIFDVAVRKGATLTLAPCAVVRVVADRGISIGTADEGDGGKLVAHGDATHPITIEGKDGARWNDVLVSAKGQADLAYVTFDSGGGTSSRAGASLHLYGDQLQPIQPLAKVDHVTIRGSGKYGMVLEGRASFADGSQNLVVSGSGDMALRVNAPALGTIPTGTFTGNTVDAIRLFGSGSYERVDADVTLHDRGVPYVVGGDGEFSELFVQGKDGTAPVLTIEAGVVLKFGKGSGGVFVETTQSDTPARAALRVLGTAAKPVVFTSNEATPAAGDWVGIFFNGIPNAQTKIDYARVEYAGADSQRTGFSCGTPGAPSAGANEAAIAIFGQPSSAFVTNTVITNSAVNGIERAWTGTPVDFLATNTFTSVAYCRQTYPRPSAGSCPVPAPCD